uniref:Uncharacterized protein n=1 Tax=Medicago truncatula TaxID=3880 RepID=Q2HU73_MEDTR|nr:hypothetical protein MtrDRAFT_AC149208g33v2 [Medicago truncatula]
METILHQSSPLLRTCPRVLILIKNFPCMMTPIMNKRLPSWISLLQPVGPSWCKHIQITYRIP